MSIFIKPSYYLILFCTFFFVSCGPSKSNLLPRNDKVICKDFDTTRLPNQFILRDEVVAVSITDTLTWRLVNVDIRKEYDDCTSSVLNSCDCPSEYNLYYGIDSNNIQFCLSFIQSTLIKNIDFVFYVEDCNYSCSEYFKEAIISTHNSISVDENSFFESYILGDDYYLKSFVDTLGNSWQILK